MIAKLIIKNRHYICSNCMMRQEGIPPYCKFCGYEFSNWEELAFKDVMEEIKRNESNIYRTT